MTNNMKTPQSVLDAFINETDDSYRFARQATAPDWFDFAIRENIGLAYKVTMGTSAKNEWYLFATHEQAVETISTFKSDCYHQDFAIAENNVYRVDEANGSPLNSHELIECFYAESSF